MSGGSAAWGDLDITIAVVVEFNSDSEVVGAAHLVVTEVDSLLGGSGWHSPGQHATILNVVDLVLWESGLWGERPRVASCAVNGVDEPQGEEVDRASHIWVICQRV